MGISRDSARRRFRGALIGVVVVLLAATVAVVLVITRDSGDDGTTDTDTSPLQAAPTASKRVVNRRIGAAIRRPDGWSAARTGRTIRMRSRDRATAVTVSLPPQATRSAAVLRSAVKGLRQAYRRVTIAPGDDRKVGSLPTVSAVAHATDARRARIDLLVASPQGRRRAWLVVVISGPDRRGGQGLVEAQVALGTLELSG